MTTISELKARLLSLPQKRTQADLGAVFTAHLQQITVAKERVRRARICSSYANEALPSSRYANAQSYATKAAQQALRIQTKLKANPESVKDDAVGNGFIAVNEHATNAWRNCGEAWDREIEEKVRDWAALVDVLNKLVPGQGRRLRGAVSALQAWRGKPPETSTDAKKVRQQLQDLNEIVASLGLKDEFGRFLKAVTMPNGAELRLVLSKDVQERLNDHKLWEIFRIKLPS